MPGALSTEQTLRGGIYSKTAAETLQLVGTVYAAHFSNCCVTEKAGRSVYVSLSYCQDFWGLKPAWMDCLHSDIRAVVIIEDTHVRCIFFWEFGYIWTAMFWLTPVFVDTVLNRTTFSLTKIIKWRIQHFFTRISYLIRKWLNNESANIILTDYVTAR